MKKKKESKADRIYKKVLRNEKGEFGYINCFVCGNDHIPVREDRNYHYYVICMECYTIAWFKTMRAKKWLVKQMYYEPNQYVNVV